MNIVELQDALMNYLADQGVEGEIIQHISIKLK